MKILTEDSHSNKLPRVASQREENQSIILNYKVNRTVRSMINKANQAITGFLIDFIKTVDTSKRFKII